MGKSPEIYFGKKNCNYQANQRRRQVRRLKVMSNKTSAKLLDLTLLDSWLGASGTTSNDTPPYTYLLFKELDDVPDEFWDELFKYINHAHEGARQALRKPLGDTLHPLHHGKDKDPAFGYPQKFGDTALQGFFGEIVAGVIAENYVGEDDINWEVPVYLFRTHVVAFQQLEYMKQTDNWERQIVGRTGDDGLAFIRDDDNKIVAWLACEAKCTRNHSAGLIADNHEKLSQSIKRPIDLLRLIDALEDYKNDKYARNWIKAIRDYYWADINKNSVERCDLSVYICGQLPERNDSWIVTDNPHSQYTGDRELTSAEVHLPKVSELIKSLYSRMESEK